MTVAADSTTSSAASWESLILSDRPAQAVWSEIFKRLGEVALSSSPSSLQRETVIPDRMIAESAWDLWQSFPTDAPKITDAIRAFWTTGSGSAGTAVLILDALSLRELPLIVNGAAKRDIPVNNIMVCGSQVPTETMGFAAALGLTSRSQLFNNQPPASFVLAGPDVHTDVLEEPFGDCVARVPAKTRLFLWHKWPDEPLIHDHSEQREGDTTVAAEIKRTLSSDDFWSFVNALRQGRRLLITGDHGYAAASDFSSEIKDEESVRLFATMFGAQRAIPEDPQQPWPRRHLPPPVLKFEAGGKTWLVVIGQRKWKVRGGFPTLCHRGLSLLEAAVPVIELAQV